MEKNVNKIVGENLIKLRKSKGLTQLEVAKTFNFSDKTISKWESGESLPSLEVLMSICDYFKITINDLVSEDFKVKTKEEEKRNIADITNKVLITLLAVTVIWIMATVIFIYHNVYRNTNYWVVFIWAVPVSLLVSIVANAVWGRWLTGVVLSSFFVWTFLASIYIHLLKFNLWIIFILGIPVQIAIILWASLKRNKLREKEKYNK